MKKRIVMSVAVITALMFLGSGLSFAADRTRDRDRTKDRDCQSLTTDVEALTLAADRTREKKRDRDRDC